MIKGAKRAIYAILGNADITDKELMTGFTGAEALLNSRPLTSQSANHTADAESFPLWSDRRTVYTRISR